MWVTLFNFFTTSKYNEDVDNLSKALKNFFDYAKDTISRNVVSAARGRLINIPERDLTKLISIIETSINEAYIKASPAIEKSLSAQLKQSKGKAK